MQVFVVWLGLVSSLPAPAVEPGALAPGTIRLQIEPGPYLVGQAIRLDLIQRDRATLDERGDLLQIDPPRVPQADLLPVQRDQSASSKLDPTILARFVLVPRRVGRWSVPSFRVRRGDQNAATKPVTINVANVPASGRTPAFLGGVGSFEVASAVTPGVTRVGSPVEFQITMTGPAALGSNQNPDLSTWSRLAPSFQVREASHAVEPGDPPTRTWRYRLRPMQPGRAVLPPIPVAAFDPAANHFATRYTPSLTLQVEAQPRFDPGQVKLGPTTHETTTRAIQLALVPGDRPADLRHWPRDQPLEAGAASPGSPGPVGPRSQAARSMGQPGDAGT